VPQNSHKAREAQGQFIERFLPNGGAEADMEDRDDAERVPTAGAVNLAQISKCCRMRERAGVTQR
jgi:hypothetical protein